ncbi:glycosyltransferase [Blastopirellula marina]|uniref:Glycosyl transferase family 2 n=1 Tax=Blastopirellula marina TaxID=124 RepID=A0A2S8GJS7_9BACT|nr:glycosyltransferase [Blastopirellula marina]PQO44571.1 glycosyl transferase family 2 [Blastopirellula marina]
MKSSVIITTHNRSYYLDKVLHGYLNQKTPPHEVVIADDGSSDETPEVIQKYQDLAPFPILHAWYPFGGMPQLCKARNAATRLSTGDYLIYTDGDCIPGPTFISDHEHLATPGYYVQGRRNFLRYSAFDTFTGSESTWELLKCWLSGRLTKLHLLVHIPGFATTSNGIYGVRGCNIAAWRQDVLAINGWNEQFVGFWREDSEFITRLMRSGVKRRNALYSAVLFHMEHEKFFNEEDFERNNALLEASKDGPIFVDNGLMPTPDATPIALPEPQAA